MVGSFFWPIFANQKRWQNCVRVDEDLNRQTKQVIRIIDSFRMATTLKNVTGAFRKSGIVTYVSKTGVLMARVDTRYATRVRHFENEEDIDDDDDDEEKRRVKIEFWTFDHWDKFTFTPCQITKVHFVTCQISTSNAPPGICHFSDMCSVNTK